MVWADGKDPQTVKWMKVSSSSVIGPLSVETTPNTATINTTTAEPSVSIDGAGNVQVVWRKGMIGGKNYGIYGRRYFAKDDGWGP